MDVGPAELIIVLVIVLLLFGGKKLPELAARSGRPDANCRTVRRTRHSDPETKRS